MGDTRENQEMASMLLDAIKQQQHTSDRQLGTIEVQQAPLRGSEPSARSDVLPKSLVAEAEGVPMRSLKALILAVGLLAANLAQARTIVFQKGTPLPTGVLDVGAQDTEIEAANPSSSFGTDVTVRSDLDYLGAETQALLRFDGLFGSLPDPIPLGSTITSAVLTLEVFNSSNAPSASSPCIG